MKLDVLSTETPWYADGLKFTCSQCGNCCTGGPGYVWISREEIVRLAEYLKITPEETVERYCRKANGRFSLNENRNAAGLYDCVFLREEKASNGDGQPSKVIRSCSVYPARPLQCRTWPFWKENLSSQKVWDHSARRCHGMNHGRNFDLEKIVELRDATDWPDRPPTSKQ